MRKRFAHYSPETGEITEVTREHVDHFDARRVAGEIMIEVDELVDVFAHRVDLATLALVPKGPSPIDPAPQLEAAILAALARSDWTQAADADDALDADQILAWRAWRRDLRRALASVGFDTMRANLPGIDPKGRDPFAQFRSE